MNDYQDFLAQKTQLGCREGFEPIEIPEFLFGFQNLATDWAIRAGRAGLYAACGLGKTPMQLTFADNVARHTNKPTIIVTTCTNKVFPPPICTRGGLLLEMTFANESPSSTSQ